MIRPSSLCLPLVTLLLGGCATFTLYMPEKEGGPDYVIVKTRGNTEKVFDCYSAPNSETWDPTCVKVKFRESGLAQEKRGVRTEERMEKYEEKRERKGKEADEGEDAE